MKKVVITYFPGSFILNLNEDNTKASASDDLNNQNIAKVVSQLLFEHLAELDLLQYDRVDDENHGFSLRFGGGCITLSWMMWNPLFGTLTMENPRESLREKCLELLERVSVEHPNLIEFTVAETSAA